MHFGTQGFSTTDDKASLILSQMNNELETKSSRQR
ncbi:Uncharacterised protein [Vibrio cholerae]|nr:Uncharacterised protein [Vibrio cholerae]CSI56207.1 Uncharacterised protein [Vibrio cholerae]